MLEEGEFIWNKVRNFWPFKVVYIRYSYLYICDQNSFENLYDLFQFPSHQTNCMMLPQRVWHLADISALMKNMIDFSKSNFE